MIDDPKAETDVLNEADEFDVELQPAPYPFVPEDDQKLRCFILKHYSSTELAPREFVDGLNKVFRWIKEGTVPRKTSAREEAGVEVIDGGKS